MKEKLIKRLLELPEEIANSQKELLDLMDSEKTCRDSVIQLETVLKSEIASALDASGKKLYTNDITRDAAFNELSAENDELVNFKDEYSNLQRKTQECRITIEMLVSEQKNSRTILNFLGTGDNSYDVLHS